MPTHPEVVTLDPSNPDDMARLGRAATNADKDDCPRDADFGINVFRLLTAPPAPEEPPLYTVVHVPSLNQWQRWTRLDQPTGRNWVDNRADWSSWPEVCALGTPEVLEPESVKALREQHDTSVTALRNERDDYRHGRDLEARRHDEQRARAEKAEAKVQRVREAWRTWPQMTRSHDESNAEMRRLWGLLRDALTTPPATEDEPAEPAPVEVTEPEPNTRLIDAIGHKWHRTEGCRRWHNDSVRRSECLTWDDLREHHGPLTLVETGGQS